MKTTVTAGTPARRPARDTMQLEDLNALAALLRKAVGAVKDDQHRRRSLRYADAATTGT